MRNSEATTCDGCGILAGAVACAIVLIASCALGQSTPAPAQPAPAKFTGCVQRVPTDKDTLVLSGDTVCAKLTGTFTADDLAGHLVDLTGVLTARTHDTPASIDVSSVASVGKSCASTCSLRPPGTRGLGKGGQIPGKEGGTPGVSAQPPQP